MNLATVLKGGPGSGRYPKGSGRQVQSIASALQRGDSTLQARRQEAPTDAEWTQIQATKAKAEALIQDAVGPQTKVFVSNWPIAIESATIVASTLKEMRDKGYPMPDHIIVDLKTVIEMNPSGETVVSVDMDAPIGHRKPTSVMSIMLPEHAPAEMTPDMLVAKAFGGQVTSAAVVPGEGWFTDREATMIDRFTARTLRDIVIHEMGHVLAGLGNQNPDSPWFKTPTVTLHDVAGSVSKYARKNADEFIAESFTRLYRGEKLRPDALTLYQGMKGPAIR